jgi:hypothetical protein
MRIRHLEFIAVLLIALASMANAGVEKTATLCGNGICPHWWPKLSVPAGWHHDHEFSVHYNFNALVPDGQSFSDTETVMYANAVFKPRVPESKTLKDFITNDHASFREETPDLAIVPDATLTTADGKSATSWLLQPKTAGQWERVAYLDEGEYYMVFVISSRTQAGLNKNMPVYELLIRNYKE